MSNIPGVEKDNRGNNFKPEEEEKRKKEQEKAKSRIYLGDLNLED